ncbi:MAG: type restriction enzyme subunit [Anaerophaga sp.]|jgi:type I restriction enzyme S subunit|nr:type restriction enzyme subunit [Anaerophaga sp.]
MNNNNKLVPKLRFPEFKDNGEWELMQISNILNAESSNLALNKLELKQSGYAVYGADSIVGYIENFQHKEPYISIVKDGSGVGKLNLCDGETSTLGTLSSLKSKDEKKYKVVWAFYLLNTIDFSSYVKGSGIPHIYFSDYKSENIGVPKIEEQQKIAACLSSLDEVIAGESQKLELLKEHKKGLLQNLFPQEGETVPKLRFPEFKDSGEWEEKSLIQVANYENGKAHEQDIVEGGNYIVVNSKFISSDGEVKKFTNTAFCPAQKGDILMVLSDVPNGKAIAKCFLVEEEDRFTVNQRVCRITPNEINSKILFYLLNRNPYFLAFDDGVKQTNLRKEDVLNCPLLIPSDPKEQQKIADTLSSLDALINTQSQKVEALQLHKKGLLQGMFPTINNEK